MKHGKHSLTFAFPILLKMALYRKKRFTRKIVSDHMKELTNTLILFIGIFFLNRVQVLHYNTPSHHKKKKEQNILNHSDEIKF